LAMVRGPRAALAEVDALESRGRLSGYRYLPALKADLLERLVHLQDRFRVAS
jgi:RNA polymerase sigma-70 factor (ECF subfamily)